jgi:hypothetical protein
MYLRFVMDFVYVHSSPWWYWCGLSVVVLTELFSDGVSVCVYILGVIYWCLLVGSLCFVGGGGGGYLQVCVCFD